MRSGEIMLRRISSACRGNTTIRSGHVVSAFSADSAKGMMQPKMEIIEKRKHMAFFIAMFRLSAKGTDAVMKPGAVSRHIVVCYTSSVGFSILQNPDCRRCHTGSWESIPSDDLTKQTGDIFRKTFLNDPQFADAAPGDARRLFDDMLKNQRAYLPAGWFA